MSTPAQERLNRLFANKSLPPKPQPEKPTLLETESEARQKHERTITDASVPASNKFKQQQIQNPAERVALASSDEEDDYVLACSTNAKMKSDPPQKRSKPGPGTSNYVRNNEIEQALPIRYIPDGKKAQSQETTGQELEWTETGDFPDYEKGKVMIGKFCLFSLVVRFPYKYMNDIDDRVSRRFFASNKVYSRTWDLHYIYPPERIGTEPFIVVPLSQVEGLIGEISSVSGIKVSVPPFPFTMPFYDDGTPYPVFAGTSRTRDEVQTICNGISDLVPGHGECPTEASLKLELSFRNWTSKCDKLQKSSKKKSTAKRTKHAKQSLTTQQTSDQLKRVECYFGLRAGMKTMPSVEGLGWDAQQDVIQEYQFQLKRDLTIPFIDINKQAPHDFYNEPIIISVDVESYERNHSLITEVGVSTLDTLDLQDIIPGSKGDDWTKQIRSRHFWIKGREHLVNREFVTGCPQAFQFGTSERVDIDEVAVLVDSCFEWPYSVQFKHDGTSHADSQSGDGRPTYSVSSGQNLELLQKGPKRRNVIFLGHDTSADLTYLSKLGSEIFGSVRFDGVDKDGEDNTARIRILASIIETLDTTSLYKALKMDSQTKSLASVCADLDTQAWNLHNAGNDARYTLEALVKMAIKARLLEDEAARQINPKSFTFTESESDAERQRKAFEKIIQARRDLEAEFMLLDNAKLAALPTPQILSSTFQNSLPILIKKAVKPPQSISDPDQSTNQWPAAQDPEPTSTTTYDWEADYTKKSGRKAVSRRLPNW